MASEWPVRPLEEIAGEITVGFVGPMVSEYVDAGIPFLRSQNVAPLKINLTDVKFISPDFHKRIRKSAIGPGDVVIVRTGKPGTCAMVPDWLTLANCSDLVIVRCGKALMPEFLAYYINTAATHHISSHLVGAVQQHFNVGAARRILIPLPSLVEQERIVEVLRSFDKKIELNHTMNETLEAMARALFKSWFVDFDPVRAKAEGRDPGLPSSISDLFPDSMVESERDDIPSTWRLETLGNLIELAYGRALKEADRKTGRVAVFGSNGQIGWHDEKLADGPGVIVGRKGNPGFVTWAPTSFFVIDTAFYVIPKGACNSLCFLYFALKAQDLASLGADSAVPGLNRNMAYMSKQLVPPPAVLQAFDRFVGPLFERIQKNKEESQSLAALRDALLPKLISGELRLSARQELQP